MKRIFFILATILFTGSVVAGGTGAFFSDIEASLGNTFTAGALDLKVDSVAHYNGMICFNSGPELSDGYAWHPFGTTVEWDEDASAYVVVEGIGPTQLADEIQGFNKAHPALNPKAGDPCDGTWELTDLGPTHKFFNFSDLKPGDSGENTISIHVYNNDAYVCAVIDNMADDDLGLTEPEMKDGDTTDGPGQGELSEYLRFFAWDDDGDNIWEAGEAPLFSNIEGSARDVLDGVSYLLRTPKTGPLVASTTAYIGIFWCFGELSVDQSVYTLSCDGAPVNNIPQTDSLSADITFYVEQARHNDGFTCPIPTRPDDDDDGSDDGPGDDGGGSDDGPGDPILVEGQATTTDMGVSYQSFRNQKNDSPDEVILGTMPLVGGGKQRQDLIWLSGTNTVSLAYDAVADTLTSIVNGGTPLVFPNVSSVASCTPSHWNTFQVYVKEENGADVVVNGLTIDGFNFPNFVGSQTGNYWYIYGLPLGDGFLATAHIVLSGTFNNNGAGNEVQFSVGCGA